MREGNEDSHGWPVLESIQGRVVDIVLNIEGVGIIPFVISKAFKVVNYVGRWQFVQETATKYQILVDHIERCNVESLREYFVSILGRDATITVKTVDEIPTLPSGKTKLIINEYAQRSGDMK